MTVRSANDRNFSSLALLSDRLAALGSAPFPADTASFFREAPAGQVAQVLDRLAFRLRLGEGAPDLPEILRRHLHGRSRPELLPGILLGQLCERLRKAIVCLPADVRRRLEHLYQVMLQPPILRNRMDHFLGMCLLPGRHRRVFPPHGLIDLEQLRVLTLTQRRHRERGRVETLFDVKLHRMHVDEESLRVEVGGKHTIYARYFSWPLGRGGVRTVALTDTDVVDGGLAAHRAMELAAVAARHVQRTPEFPRIYLGFAPRASSSPGVYNQPYDFERSPGLELAAAREVDRWLCSGRPARWPALSLEGTGADVPLRQRLQSPCRSWTDIERALGPVDAELLLQFYWCGSVLEHEGLELVPLDFFAAYSPQRPARLAVRTFARVPPYLAAWADGPAAQVISTPSPVYQSGELNGFRWDFRGAPAGREKLFQPAGGPPAEGEAPETSFVEGAETLPLA